MTGWIIFLGIFAVLLFLLLCRIRVEFSYSETFQLEIRYLFLRFPLLPGKQKGLGKASPKPGKSGRKKRKNSSQAEKKTAGRRIEKTVDVAFDEFMEKISNIMSILRSILYGVDLLLRHITIDRVHLNLRVGGEDPAQAGISYGKTCILVYTGLAALQNYLKIKVEELNLVPEMMEEVFSVKASLRVCIPVYVALWAAAGALWKLLVRMVKMQMAAAKDESRQTEGV